MKKIILILISVIVTCLIIYYLFKKQRRDSINKTLKQIYELGIDNFEDNEQRDTLGDNIHVYCITLPHRKEYIKNMLNNFNINVTYFNAIEHLSKKDCDILSDNCKNLPLHVSYTMCIMNSFLNGYENIAIFEDNIAINVTKNKLVNSISEFLKSDFVMFCMGGYNKIQHQETNKFKYIKNIPYNNLLCNHSIILKTKYLQQLIENIYPMYSDKSFLHFFKKKGYKICVSKKPYFHKNNKVINK